MQARTIDAGRMIITRPLGTDGFQFIFERKSLLS